MDTRRLSPAFMLVAAALALFLAAGCAAKASREDIRSALREDPDLVLGVLREHPLEMDRILAATAAAREDRLREARRREELERPLAPDLSGDRISLGPADAPVLMVAYSDFLCSHCADAAQTVHTLLSRHPGQIHFVYKHFPHSRFAAELGLYFEALGRQDPALAWRFHDEIFLRQGEIMKSDGILAEILEKLAPDQTRLDLDLRDLGLHQRLTGDTREADRFGFDGTPSFVIGGVSLVGSLPLEKFEEVLDLAAKKQPAAASGEWAPSGDAPCADCLQK
jgi:protein-disulfide isomerase